MSDINLPRGPWGIVARTQVYSGRIDDVIGERLIATCGSWTGPPGCRKENIAIAKAIATLPELLKLAEEARAYFENEDIERELGYYDNLHGALMELNERRLELEGTDE